MNKTFYLKFLLLLCVFIVGAQSVLAEDTVYTKWKKTASTSLATGDVVVIVDLNSAEAMTNDKGTSKAPGATSVTLNDPQTRITDESVDDNLQWTVTVTEAGFKFAKLGSDTEFLYGDASKGLRVGTEAACEFDMLNDFLHISLDGTNYYVGAEESFMSSSWKLLAEEEGNIPEKIAETQIAFFKKVETTAEDIEFEFPFKNYQVDAHGSDHTTDYKYWFDLEINHNCPENIENQIVFTSSDPDVAEVADFYGQKRVRAQNKKVGTATITAYFPGSSDGKYDDATATCTVRVEDSGKTGHCASKPITVAEAIALASGDNPPAEGVCYYIKGKVSKVNSGLMALFGEFGLDDILGDEELDFDFDDFEMEGVDMSSTKMPGFGNSGQTTYYISDDATKGNQLKVVKGFGAAIRGGSNNCGIELGELDGKDLTVGDEILVFGPLVYTEDSNMFGSLMGGGNDDEEEPEKTPKVDEVNYRASINKVLLTHDMSMYLNSTKTLNELFTLTKTPEGTVSPATVTSSDEEIAKWVLNDEGTDSVFTALKEGKAKITVKIKVTLAEDDPNTEENEEQSYVMKSKFKLNVITRDVEPLGSNNGDYVLVTDASSLYDGDRLIIVGTTTKDDETKYQALGTDDAMMGGGKTAKEVDVEDNKVTNLPDGVQEIILERDTENADIWYLNVGENEDGEKLYLYASNKPESEQEGDDDDDDDDDDEEESGFDFTKLMEMIGDFGSSYGLKVGTKTEAGDSCQVAINVAADGTTLTFNVPDKKNIIKLGNGMDGFMEMFGSFLNNDEKEEEGEEGSDDDDDDDDDNPMAGINISMPTFNIFDDEDTKATLPQIYHYVPAEEYEIYIDNSHWTTVVSAYDVTTPVEEENKLAVYIVTGVELDDNPNASQLVLEETDMIKAGVPYLVTGVNRDGTFTLTRVDNHQAPVRKNSPARVANLDDNLLKVSDSETADGAYLLENKDGLAVMARWNEGVTGSGHAYLPEDEVSDGRDYVPVVASEEPVVTGINDVAVSQTNAVLGCFDLSGREVKGKPHPGIYILNGKKVIIK